MYPMMARTRVVLPAMAAVAVLVLAAVSPQPERESQEKAQDQGKTPDGTLKTWDPALRFDSARLKQRLEALLAIEDEFRFVSSYWELVQDTHRASTVFYHGDRAVLSQGFFLLQDRSPEGGWTLLDTDEFKSEYEKHEIAAERGIYVLRRDNILRVADVQDDDVVFVSSKTAAVIVWLDESGAGAAVEPAALPELPRDGQ